uniref:CYTH domain-containing protein n=1 Tax=viral metagenome TaxID=1070528 RepID=A0A6C0D9L6_9ZZZZ
MSKLNEIKKNEILSFYGRIIILMSSATEIEYQFYGYPKDQVLGDLVALGAKKRGTFVFRVQVFNGLPGTYIRVRDEGFRITMTYKIKIPESEFEEEHEVLVDNFDAAVNILLGVGCTKKYAYEKIREIWDCENSEIVFDTNPGEPERMKIESKTLIELSFLTDYLCVSPFKVDKFNPTLELFGFSMSSLGPRDLKFDSVQESLGPLVTKNKADFDSLVESQKAYLLSLSK